MGMFDQVFQFGAVVASTIVSATLDIADQVLGVGGIEDDDSDGEQAPAQVRYGPLGLLWRSLPPDVKSGPRALYSDVLCAKTADGLLPIAWRDERINRAFPSGPKPGTIALAGYGKGFYALDLTTDATAAAAPPGSAASQVKSNVHTIYCPYDFDPSGVAQKAHCVALDPTAGNESVSITHGDGLQISLVSGSTPGINMNVDANTFLHMGPGALMLNCAKIILQGNCVLGANSAAAVPLLPGVASPPSTSVFVSP